MADQRPPVPPTPPAELAELGEWIDGLIQELTAHPDPTVGARAFALLDGVDALHRAALGRLVALLAAPGGAAVWAQARQDPVIRAVLLLYDLVQEGDRVAQREGTPQESPAPHPAPLHPARHEQMPTPGKRALPMIAPHVAAVVSSPQWHDAISLDQVPPGTLRGCHVVGVAVLLCNVAGDIFAYEDACPDTPLALSSGQLDGSDIVCPWHGCRFEARTGRRVVHEGTGLRPLPLTVEGGWIRVAVNLSGPPTIGARAIAISNRSHATG